MFRGLLDLCVSRDCTDGQLNFKRRAEHLIANGHSAARTAPLPLGPIYRRQSSALDDACKVLRRRSRTELVAVGVG